MFKINIYKLIYLKFIIIILVVLFILQIFLKQNSKLKTETVHLENVYKTAEIYGVFFKDEYVVYDDYDVNEKIIKNVYEDGEHVAKNSEIVQKFKNENEIKVLLELNKIDEKIKSLNKIQNLHNSNNKNYINLNKQITDSYFKLFSQLHNKNFIEFKKTKNNLIDYLNQQQLMKSNVQNFNKTILSLEQKRNQILKQNFCKPIKVLAPESGYFVGSIDGLENECNLSKINDFDENDLNKIYEEFDFQKINFSKCKLIINPKIYFKAIVPIQFNLVDKLNNSFILNLQQIDEEIESELVEFKLCKSGLFYLATFEINCMTNKLASLRKSIAKINFKNSFGFKINKFAVRQNSKNETGVFIVVGSKLKFKLIEIMVEDDDFVVAKPHENDLNYLQELDEVVVSGKNLFENKKIEK